ncbi:MAG TPA: TetR/AcrR family transcriptional regulator [Ilumatobacteraceae bacterium]
MPPASEDRRHTEQGRERKQQLVEAAMALFAERGYAATRIIDICEAAGVAKGLFYWYFPTKLDLFAELVRTMRRRLRVAQAEAMTAGAPPVQRIREGAEASVRFMAENAAYFALVEMERTDPEVAKLLQEGSEIYLDDVVALVREAQGDGDLPDVEPRLVALGVLGTVSTFSNGWRHGRVNVTVDELAAFVGEWVERSLAAG